MFKFTFKKYNTDSDRSFIYKVERQGQISTYNQIVDLLINSETFRLDLTNTLRQSDFDAFFWEVKPCSKSTLENEFEFVTVFEKSISQNTMDPEPFKAYFNNKDLTFSFKNLVEILS